MQSIFQVLDKIIHLIEDIICGTTLAAIVAIATASVVGRYIFHTGFLWADEVNQALLVAMCMFGSARAVRTNGHTEFTLLISKTKSKSVRIALRTVFFAISIIFLVLMLVWSTDYAAHGTMRSATLRIPRMYYYMSIPIGFALMLYEYLRSAKRRTIEDSETGKGSDII